MVKRSVRPKVRTGHAVPGLAAVDGQVTGTSDPEGSIAAVAVVATRVIASDPP